jgi:transposase-like protein
MEERGVELDHATVQRWVVKYTPILEVEFRKRKKAVGTSW